VTLCGAIAEVGDPSPFLFARDVGAWLAGQTQTQIAALRERRLDCLLIVDEPALNMAGVESTVIEAWEPLRTVGAAWGLHVCWPALRQHHSLQPRPETEAGSVLKRHDASVAR